MPLSARAVLAPTTRATTSRALRLVICVDNSAEKRAGSPSALTYRFASLPT